MIDTVTDVNVVDAIARIVALVADEAGAVGNIHRTQ
jgi:hypothetical protein